jgi:tetratricopeptide (TPR) repeat protein
MLRRLPALFVVIGCAARLAPLFAAESSREKNDPVCLGVRELNPLTSRPQAGGLLVREIVRQALLIAARDECGLATRDRTLGESLEGRARAGAKPLTTLIATPLTDGSDTCHVRVAVLRGNDGTPEPLWQTTVDIPRYELIPLLVDKAEAWSRKEFKQVLSQNGPKGTVPAPRASAEIPESVQNRLWAWNEIAVFTALRQLHAEIREKGESPEFLAGLVVGYANLGLMTELRWSAAHKAFKARALVYAERLVRKSGSSGWALAHRAYVRALVGLHAAAALDAGEARRKQAEKSSGLALPDWLPVIERTCAGKAGPEVSLYREPERSLAFMLWIQTATLSGLGEELPKWTAPIFAEHPDCFRLVDALLGRRQIGLSRAVTPESFSVFAGSLDHRLGDVPGLPEKVRQRLGKPRQGPEEISRMAAIIGDLQTAGRAEDDRREPSLTVLGNLVDDLGFQLAWRRLDLDKFIWGVSTDEDLSLLSPLSQYHPYGPYLDTFSDRRDERRAAIAKYRQFNWSQLQLTENPLAVAICGTNKKRLANLHRIALSHLDPVYLDLMARRSYGFLQRSSDEKENEQVALLLRSVSPKMPRVIALLIDFDWKGFEKRRIELEKDFADVPNVLLMLAAKYDEQKQFVDEERCLRQVIRVQPSHPNYERLAFLFARQKDMKRWQATLEEAIKLPSLGLESSNIQVDIAEYHLRHNELAEARPFAESAAVSYSARSLMTLAHYYELKHDWKKAEEIIKAEIERYPSNVLGWMAWCRRTGHGDANAAQEASEHYFSSLGTPAPANVLPEIATYYQFTGEPQKSLALLKRSYEVTKRPLIGLRAAVLADSLDDASTRDTLLEQVAAGNQTGSPQPRRQNRPEENVECYHEAAAAFREALHTSKPLDLKRIEVALAKSTSGQPTSVDYLVGMFLEKRGDREKSKIYLMRSATSPKYREYTSILAVCALRERKIPIDPPRDEEVAK